jgi:hypothetical protein
VSPSHVTGLQHLWPEETLSVEVLFYVQFKFKGDFGSIRWPEFMTAVTICFYKIGKRL